jgi:hypothetical protein
MRYFFINILRKWRLSVYPFLFSVYCNLDKFEISLNCRNFSDFNKKQTFKCLLSYRNIINKISHDISSSTVRNEYLLTLYTP